MKRKLLFLLCALLTSVGMWAGILDGWTKMETNVITSPENYYFVILHTDNNLMLGATKECNIDKGNKSTSTKYDFISYQTAAEPSTDLAKVWSIENCTAEGYTSAYVLRSLVNVDCPANIGASYQWELKTDGAVHEGSDASTAFNIIPSGSYWQIQDATATAYYWGAWNNARYQNDERVAGNAGGNGQESGSYNIYYMLRSTFNKKYQSSGGTDMSYLIVNRGFEYGNTTGWTYATTGSHGALEDHGAKSANENLYKMTNSEGSYLFNIYAWGYATKQTISNIPKGKYTVSAVVASSSDGAPSKVYLLANDTHEGITCNTSAGTGVNGEVSTLVTNGSLTIGAVGSDNDQSRSYTSEGLWWFKADNFQLTYNGNDVQYYAPEPTNFSEGVNVDVEKWYKVAISDNGCYKITSLGAASISYTQTQTKDADDNDFPVIEFDAAGDQQVLLRSGSFYFKSDESVNITITELGNDVQYYAPEATDFSEATSATSGTWYKVTTTKGYYDITASDAVTIKYTQDASQDADDGTFTTLTFTEAGTQRVLLNAGTLYFKTSATKDITIASLGNGVEYYATVFSSGASATASTWYAVTISADGIYKVSSTVNATLSYTQDGTKDADANDFSSLAIKGGSHNALRLSEGTLYFKSSATCTLTITALDNNTNVTDVFITNPSFETGNSNGWSLNNTKSNIRSTQNELDNKVGTYYFLIQSNNTYRNISQLVSLLPQGKFILSVNAKSQNDASNNTLNMGSCSTPIPVGLGADTYFVAFETAENNENATIKLDCSFGDGTRKVYCDNFVLTYYTELPAVDISSLTSEAMAPDVRAALTSASSIYNGSKTVANYNALQTAIVNAKVSIAEFAAKTGDDADWTDIITNPSFETGTPNYYKGWTVDVSSGSSTSDEQHRYKEGGMGSEGAGSWRFFIWTSDAGAATIKQTVSELPVGNYKLSAYMASEAGDVFTLTAGSTSSKVIASDGNATLVEVYFTQATQGNIEISARHSNSWFDLDNFHLTCDPTLPESISGVDGDMNAAVREAQTTAVSTYNSSNTFANMLSAQTAIKNAVESIQMYKEIATIRDNYQAKADELDAAGQTAYTAAINVASTGALTQYTAGAYASISDAETAFHNDYVIAVKAQTTANTDMTEAITNPSFESATGVSTTIAGWTNEANKTLQTQSNKSWAKVGTYYCERWHSTGDKSIYQPITDLHSGAYILTAKAYAGDATAQVYAMVGETKYAIDVTATENYSVLFNYDGTSTLKIGFSGNMGDDANTGWMCVDDFHLIYSGASQPDLDLYTTEPMNATVKTNANTAINTYNDNKTSENYTAAQAAIVAAEASIAVYETINSIMSTYATKAAALDVAGQSAYSTAINTESTGAAWKYTNGEYETSAEAETEFSGAYVAAVKSQNTAGADMTDAMPTGNSGWTCTQGNGPNSYSVATETYVSSGGGFTKGDGDYKKIMYQSIDGLPAGLYMVEFYGISNSANNVSTVEGSGIVQAYANDADLDITVIKQNSCTPTDYPRTLYCSVGVDGTLEYGLKSIANGSNWAVCKIKALTYLGNTSAVMAVNSTAKWGTFCAPFDVAIPADVDAYTCSEVKDGVLTLTPVETTISANTPVILNAESGLESTTFYGVREGSSDIVNVGLLYGNVSASAQNVPSDGTAYLLQLINDKVGFYKVSESGYMIGINRCYLVSEVALAREAFLLEGEGETAINEIEAVEAKAEGLKDGKYLINGRIVIVKDGKTLSISGQILK